MADIAITAANVIATGGARQVDGVAGAAIVAGDMLYRDAATHTYKLADCDSGTAAVRSPAGMALNNAAIGQPIKLAKSGAVTVGAALTAGVTYYLSPTPGKICPIADVQSADYPVIVGIAKSSSILDIRIHEAGVALA